MAHKRANNEGSIYYRKNRGEWCAQVSLNGRRLTKYAKTQRECRDWIREMVTKIGNGLTFESSRVTLEQFVQAWMTGKEMSRRPGTVHNYRTIVELHILPNIGKMRLQEIRPEHLRQLYQAKKEEGRGPRTIQVIHTLMYSILKQAVKEGILGRNPADAVERPAAIPKEKRILTEEQTWQLVIASTGSRHGMLIFMVLTTGMREAELLGLMWSDLDWQKGILHVRRQLGRYKIDGSAFCPPKSKAGKRDIKLGQGTLDRLAKHREEQTLFKEARGPLWVENDLIFPNTLGKPMNWRNMYADYKALLQANGLPDISFHDLRHTSLSHLLDMGTPVNTVQQRAGHSKASMTTDTYGHSITHSEVEAADRIEELVTPIAVNLQSK